MSTWMHNIITMHPKYVGQQLFRHPAVTAVALLIIDVFCVVFQPSFCLYTEVKVSSCCGEILSGVRPKVTTSRWFKTVESHSVTIDKNWEVYFPETGGLFRMAIKLMMAFSRVNTDVYVLVYMCEFLNPPLNKSYFLNLHRCVLPGICIPMLYGTKCMGP